MTDDVRQRLDLGGNRQEDEHPVTHIESGPIT